MEAPDDWLTLEPRGEGRNKWLKTWPDHIGLSGTQGKSSIKAYYVGMHIYLPFAVLASAPSTTCHYLCRVHFKAKKVISTCLGLFIVQIWIFCQPEYLHHLEVFFKTLPMHLQRMRTAKKLLLNFVTTLCCSKDNDPIMQFNGKSGKLSV